MFFRCKSGITDSQVDHPLRFEDVKSALMEAIGNYEIDNPNLTRDINELSSRIMYAMWEKY